MTNIKRIGILTGGGDCAGLNAVIRAVTKKAIGELGCDVVGILDGYEGLIHNRTRMLNLEDVSGILTLGGTILGTSNKANPYHYGVRAGEDIVYEDRSQDTINNIQELGLDCLVCIGGDGTLNGAHKLFLDGVPVIGVPKTIDNDVIGTDITFGFDSAVSVVTEGVDRIHTTAQSHHRVMIIEVMGRTAGWIALHGGVAGGGDIILIPEIPYSLPRVIDKIRERGKRGKHFSIVVVSEGAKPKGGEVTVRKIVKDSVEQKRLGGIGYVLADEIEELTGLETRPVVLGHLQRGGSPTAFDRVLATRLGTHAVDMMIRGKFGHMAGIRCDGLVDVPLEDVSRGARTVPLDHPLLAAARAVDTCFGDDPACTGKP